MEEMRFLSWKADHDVYMRPTLNANGIECYKRVLLCADDILAIMKEPEIFICE